jgi:hypothetical protein
MMMAPVVIEHAVAANRAGAERKAAIRVIRPQIMHESGNS